MSTSCDRKQDVSADTRTIFQEEGISKMTFHYFQEARGISSFDSTWVRNVLDLRGWFFAQGGSV